jgi:hypothetical protein
LAGFCFETGFAIYFILCRLADPDSAESSQPIDPARFSSDEQAQKRAIVSTRHFPKGQGISPVVSAALTGYPPALISFAALSPAARWSDRTRCIDDTVAAHGPRMLAREPPHRHLNVNATGFTRFGPHVSLFRAAASHTPAEGRDIHVGL